MYVTGSYMVAGALSAPVVMSWTKKSSDPVNCSSRICARTGGRAARDAAAVKALADRADERGRDLRQEVEQEAAAGGRRREPVTEYGGEVEVTGVDRTGAGPGEVVIAEDEGEVVAAQNTAGVAT